MFKNIPHKGATHGSTEALATAPVPLPTDPSQWKVGVKYSYASMVIILEYLAGDTRTGTAPDGTKWSQVMPAAYGYIDGTKDADGEDIDIYLASPFNDDASVLIVDQQNPDSKKFDEHKVMIGFSDESSAVSTYVSAFGDGKGQDRILSVASMSLEQFVQWVENDDHQTPVGTPASSDQTNTGLPQQSVAQTQSEIVLSDTGSKPVILKEVVDGKNIYEVYILNDFGTDKWSSVTESLLNILRSATSDDRVIIGISSFGGELDLAARIASAMRVCKAKITTVSLGPVASAGCLIWAEGQDRQITAGSYFMQHMSIQGSFGKTTAIMRSTAASAQYIKDVIYSRVQEIGLFTEQELADMFEKDRDVYITSFEAAERTKAEIIG